MNVIGIDPGIHGAVALVADDAAYVVDTPTLERKVGRKIRRRVNVIELADALTTFALPGTVAYVERAQASPRMGVSSSFAYGEAFGMVVGVLAHLHIETRFVSPSVWKREMGLVKPGARELGRDEEREKGSALELARKLYPQLADKLARAKDDGRADALLIAHWGCEQIEAAAAA
jgi:crossover junction endodeoxyribonuclease RuvC